MTMRFICRAVGAVALILSPIEAREDRVKLPQELQELLGSMFSTSQVNNVTSLAPTDSPTVHPLTGTDLPKRCEDDINNERPPSKPCQEWLDANPDFIMPTSSPSEAPSAAPSKFFKVESTSSIGQDDRPDLVVNIGAVDDTFIELFRRDTPLGDKVNIKVDAYLGIPTKVAMLKFNIGETMNKILNQNVEVTLTSAKLQLYARTTGANNQFGGFVEAISAYDWDEETATWADYVRGGKDAKKDAEQLLPTANDTLATFEGVSTASWATADLTGRLKEIEQDWSNTKVSQFAVRISTDLSNGVVYSSKEDGQFAPKLSLVFQFKGTVSEVAAAAATAESNNQDNSPPDTPNPTPPPTPLPTRATTLTPTKSPVMLTTAPTKSPLLSPTDSPTTSSPTKSPSISPMVATTSPTKSPSFSSIAATDSPTSSPQKSPSLSPVAATDSPVTKSPTKFPSISPVAATGSPVTSSPTKSPTALAAATTTLTAIDTSMLNLRIVATTEEVRRRMLKGTRVLDAYMSLYQKEGPALTEHLMNVYTETLTSIPKQVDITFANDDVADVDIVSSNYVIRESKFKVTAIFDDPRIQAIASSAASAVLERATLHAFSGAENDAFVSIFEETGEPIIRSSESIEALVSKVSYSIGEELIVEETPETSAQAATAAAENVDEEEQGNINEETAAWAAPAIAIGASLVVVASALASFILIRQRRNHYSYAEEHKNANNLVSPTNTEPMTPTPKSFGDRFRKKKFDYAEFQEDEAAPSEYDFRHVTTAQQQEELRSTDFVCPQDIKFSQFQCASFDDSTVSDVSAHIHSAKAKSLKSIDDIGAFEEQIRFDNALYSNTPNDDASVGDVPSELYSNLSMDDSSAIQSRDVPTFYGANAYMLENMIKSNKTSLLDDLPPPPSDAASDNSSQQDGKEQQLEGMFPTDPFHDNDETEIEPGSGENYQNEINEELTKVMKILGNSGDDDQDDDNTVEVGSIGNEDASDVSPISNVYGVPHLLENKVDVNGDADDSVTSSLPSEDDPVKLMNSALDDCMAILDKARPDA